MLAIPVWAFIAVLKMHDKLKRRIGLFVLFERASLPRPTWSRRMHASHQTEACSGSGRRRGWSTGAGREISVAAK